VSFNYIFKSNFSLVILPFKAQWLLCLPRGLTLKNVAFCPHSVFMCFVWISEQTAIISLYNVNWLVCITETECVYCLVRTVFMCFVWISEQTAIISLYNINWLVCITETECVYCAVPTKSLYIIQILLNKAPMEWNWQGKPELLGGNPVPVPLCLPQIPHGSTRDRTRASAVRGRLLTAWAMARPSSLLTYIQQFST
jgi:hypothetical protein